MFKNNNFRPGNKLRLNDISTDYSAGYASKEAAQERTEKNIDRMARMQDVLYAQDKYALLIIIQAMDAAGKDGVIKHVMSGLNPQGTMVHSFKPPSAEELDHDYLWRYIKALPERGRIGIFNRSYYEEVLVVRVHNLIEKQQHLPPELITKNIWRERLEDIGHLEKYLHRNGTVILKFYLHVSKQEQKERLLARLDEPDKNWKFNAGDLEERKHWDTYQKYAEEAMIATDTDYAPWYIIPADKKWFARMAISEIIADTLEGMKLEYPRLNDDQKKMLAVYRAQLLHD
ncbi:MAG TPA: polyphosphate kinase 2 family protein [Syntrophomonadaceae bacterium]|nr:polyphosphate kinase 2 family protein [Syntrophomonadaceae bacterium]